VEENPAGHEPALNEVRIGPADTAESWDGQRWRPIEEMVADPLEVIVRDDERRS
jgi:hypothetical protein